MPTDSGHFARVDALLAAALEHPPESRRDWLATTSGADPDIVREVERLLALLDPAEEMIGESAGALVSIPKALQEAADPDLPVGARLGSYEVVRLLGRGGMGAVYLGRRADQTFEREVAIKLVRRDPGAGQLLARFEAERRILAGLEHPNIARLYDSGITGDGEPFLVMEYVAGEPITRYAATRGLSRDERLALVQSACDAVAYAHRRLVVHRDLKPGNLLVTNEGRVALLDFGIARLLEGDVPAEPVTRAGHRLLTPEYASPEQLRGDPPSASIDVYALGVILHELLTDTRPDWQRLVVDGAPVGAIEPAMVPPSQVAPTLDRDLDTIVLTALAPDPEHRYRSVDALRDDLDRYRAQRPIHARPATAILRARKFVRRNPLLVAMSLLLVALGVGYVGTVLTQSSRLAAERDRAQAERAKAGEMLTLLTGLFESADPFSPGRPDTLRVAGFLALGTERVQRDLAGQPGLQAEMLTVLGGVLRQLDRLDEAAPTLERALSLRRDTPGTTGLELARSLDELGLVRLREARGAEAEELFRAALAQADSAGPDGTVMASLALGHLATALMDQGRLDTAASFFDRAVLLERGRQPADSGRLSELLNNRATAAQRLGDFPLALATIQEAWAIKRATLGSDHPSTLNDLGNIAFLTDRTGQPAEAVPMLREVVTGLRVRLAPDHPMVRSALMNLSGALSRSGDHLAAIDAAEAAVAIDRRRQAGPHFDLGISLDYLASTYDRANRPAAAERAFAEQVAVLDAVVGPSHVNAAIARVRFAASRCRAGASPDARRIALADFKRALLVIDGAFKEHHPQRIARHVAHGACLALAGRAIEAEQTLQAQFETARRHHPPGDQVMQIATRELIRLYEARGDSAGAARIRGVVDSMSAAAPQPGG